MAHIAAALNNRAQKGVGMSTALLVGILLCLAACDGPSPGPGSDVAGNPPKLGYGVRVSFGQGGNSETFKVSGWSKTEEKFTWSEGTAAALKMMTEPTNETIVLKMTIAALTKEPELPFQPVEVSVNGQKIADWQVSSTSEFTAAIPHDITKAGGMLTITIKTPKATSPKALGVNADPRVLGVCCHNVELARG